MPNDNKLVFDVLEYLSELGEELPTLRGRWAHPAGVAAYIDSNMDTARMRRLLEKLMRADLVRDCDEPAAARAGRRGAPRRLFQITTAGERALKRLANGERVSLDVVYRSERVRSVAPERTPSPEPVAVRPRSMGDPVPKVKVAAIPPGVNPFQVLYEAVEDYLEFAEPDLSPEYRVMEQACALVRAHRAGTR